MNDKYLQYQIEELVQDDDFIKYIQESANQDSWDRWLNEHPQVSSKILEAKQLIKAMQFEGDSFDRKEAVWQKINADTAGALPSDAGIMKYYIWGAMAIAASLALLFLIRTTNGDMIQSHYNNTDLLSHIVLPDESYIDLREASKISYDKANWKNKREISLEGTATFEVVKGVPFVVETKNGSVKVLGTNFTVSSEGDAFSVIVNRGKVQVESNGINQILTAGMGFVKNTVLPSADTAPTKRYYHFDKESLRDILPVLEKEFGVRFIRFSD